MKYKASVVHSPRRALVENINQSWEVSISDWVKKNDNTIVKVVPVGKGTWYKKKYLTRLRRANDALKIIRVTRSMGKLSMRYNN